MGKSMRCRCMRVEVSGRAEGPFVDVPPHRDVPTINEIRCDDVPELQSGKESVRLWVRGLTKAGRTLKVSSLTVEVPSGMHWKAKTASGSKQQRHVGD